MALSRYLAIAIALSACALPRAPPGRVLPAMKCELMPPQLTSVAGRRDNHAQLWCTAENLSHDTAQICARPYVGVPATGVVHAVHPTVCSDELAPGELWTSPVQLDFARSECDAGCAIDVFGIQPADAAYVVAFARSVENGAPRARELQPTVDDCEALLDHWRATPALATFGGPARDRNAMILQCLSLPRVAFDCLRAGTTLKQLDHCAPY
jgi:hypothetical protein